MKKKPDHRLVRSRRLPERCRLTTYAVAISIATTLSLAGCTTYRPLDQGANVPWAKALSAADGGPIDGNRYRVREGDALSRIAARYDVRLLTLAAVNNIQAPYTLFPGEVLRIPADAPLPARRPEIIETALPPAEPAVKTETAWQPVPSPQPVPEPSAEPVNEGTRYVVASGDSLALIAVRQKRTLRDLVAANDLEPPYQIEPGQILIIPATEGESSGQETAERQTDIETASSIAPPPPLSTEGFLWPVDGEIIGSFEQNNSNGRSGGVTIAARKGAPVRASDNGIVAYAGEALSGYGHMVMLRHADGYVTLYAHNDVILVSEGDIVNRGQMIAEVGDSGDVVESQLHFELRKGTAPIDPTKVLAGLPGRQIGGL